MRILLIAGAAAAAVAFDALPAKAVEAPWCAFISVAQGAVYEDCQYYSVEACRSVVLSGNRGFCNHNPRWVGPVPSAKRVRHKRHVTHD
jgi:hypothetical protein